MYRTASRHLQSYPTTPISDIAGQVRPLTEEQRMAVRNELAEFERSLEIKQKMISIAVRCRNYGKKAVRRLLSHEGIKLAVNTSTQKQSLNLLADEIAWKVVSEVAELTKRLGGAPDASSLHKYFLHLARSAVFERAAKLDSASK